MRRAVTATALAMSAALAACGDSNGNGPTAERGTAAGEVLGGEVTDDMLPLDSTRSTSPPAPRTVADGESEGESETEAEAIAAPEEPGALPTPIISGGPGRRQPVGIEPTEEPPPE